MRGLDYWHASTEHLVQGLLFQNEDDYKVGMNCVAVTSITLSIDVLAFILMSNHMHFILHCSESGVLEFVTRLKKQYSLYYFNKYGVNKILKDNKVYTQQLSARDESLERAIAYVQMNCVAANICSDSSKYRWGTGNCFFNTDSIKGKKIGEMSKRSITRITHSSIELPPNFIVSEEGYIYPSSFVKTSLVESIFKTPRRMNYFLAKSSKAQKIINRENISSPTFRDTSISPGVKDLCNSLFQKENISDLNNEQLIEIVRQLQYRYSAGANQIARVTGVPYSYVSKLLDSF